MKKLLTLFLSIVLLLTGCFNQAPKVDLNDFTYLVMEQKSNLNQLNIKAWVRADISQSNINTFGKELVYANKNLYDSIKIDFYLIKEEIDYPQSIPDAVAIWGPMGKFDQTSNRDSNIFVVEINDPNTKFTDEEYDIYSNYLRISKEKGNLDELAKNHELTLDELILLVHKISSRFKKL